MPVLLDPRFTEEDHRYSDDAGNVYPSVSELIGRYWPIDRRLYQESGAQRGKDVHELTAQMDRSTTDTVAIEDPTLQLYLDGWERFTREMVAEFVWIEQRFIDTEAGFAGTTDRLVRLKNGQLFILDIKTGRPEGWHELQQGAYALAARKCGFIVDGIGSVQINGNGKYQFVRHDIHRAISAWEALTEWHQYRQEKRLQR